MSVGGLDERVEAPFEEEEEEFRESFEEEELEVVPISVEEKKYG